MASNPEKPIGTDGTVFRCPQCKAILPSTNIKTFPFCCERCRLIDLGQWLDGKYTVSRPIDPTDQIEELPRTTTNKLMPPGEAADGNP